MRGILAFASVSGGCVPEFFALKPDFEERRGCDGSDGTVGISLMKVRNGLCFVGGRGLAFKSLHLSGDNFYEVELIGLFLRRSPEVDSAEILSVGMVFNAFHKEKVLPKSTFVHPRRQGIEIVKDGVPNAIVAEVDLLSLLELVRKVLCIRGTYFDNEALLEERNVVGHRHSVEAGFVGKSVITDFGSYIEGE